MNRPNGPNHPDRYLYIKAWCHYTGVDAKGVDRECRRASAHQAPLDVIQFVEEDSRWFRVEEIDSPVVRNLLHEHVRELARRRAEAGS